MPPISDMLVDRKGREPEEQTPKEIASNVRVWLRGSGHKIVKVDKDGNTIQ